MKMKHIKSFALLESNMLADAKDIKRIEDLQTRSRLMQLKPFN
jgi:hypothetical protein